MQRISRWINRRTGGWSIPGVVLFLLYMMPATTSATYISDVKFLGRMGVGYDTNAMREASSVTGSSLLQYFGRGTYELRSWRDRLKVDLSADGELYDAVGDDAETRTLGVDLKYDRRLIGGRRGYIRNPSLDIDLRAFLEDRRRSYYSRIAGEELSVVLESDTVSLVDRFDHRRTGGEAEVGLRWLRWLKFYGKFRLQERNYLEDYAEVPGIEPLDYRNTRWSVGLGQNLPASLLLGIEYRNSRTTYRAWSARDRDGNLVQGTPADFEYSAIEGELRTKSDSWGAVRLTVTHRERSDRFQGYYDYREWSYRPRVTLRPAERFKAKLDFSYAHREYDRARVRFNPVKALREDFERTWRVHIEYAASPRGGIFWEAVHENIDEKNESFTYSRLRQWIGYQIQY